MKAWREQYGDERVAAAGTEQTGPAAADLAARVAELEKENRRLRERELILKKAAAFFAQDHL
ncbi:transposase-like protein [Catenulispora sp. MAP5-51]